MAIARAVNDSIWEAQFTPIADPAVFLDRHGITTAEDLLSRPWGVQLPAHCGSKSALVQETAVRLAAHDLTVLAGLDPVTENGRRALSVALEDVITREESPAALATVAAAPQHADVIRTAALRRLSEIEPAVDAVTEVVLMASVPWPLQCPAARCLATWIHRTLLRA